MEEHSMHCFAKPRTHLAEDQQPLLLFLAGGQGGELLQLQGRGRRGDVQVVLKGLEDGAGWEARLILPVTDDTWGGTAGMRLRSLNPRHTHHSGCEKGSTEELRNLSKGHTAFRCEGRCSGLTPCSHCAGPLAPHVHGFCIQCIWQRNESSEERERAISSVQKCPDSFPLSLSLDTIV